ncbi:hypothetical protein SOASR030_19280 [Leminorella grimontii]|uniref:YshB family small membrane protein n=1 Tax=Leminorella grimontii TaxID=82981 RepID=A0AAV5N4Y8_9GAMM|nr:YshB family small membrane protein [Leminorella grimontii]KFC93491.1 hypothetical protein GLGR_3054 [Leminorella grimontii ATCC 33999 = DSM 5078]GKX55816.1 hypothetical protein SOASR030_19280 [Leminorella grimontii]GKX59619.1 hypothetical protein SOASR031_19340 [Leminorella grimontii]VFS55105.1 Uncharacterised protein [Leminorella grimontii]
MLESLYSLLQSGAEIGSAAGQSPQTGLAAVLCVIMFVLFS